MGMGVGGLCKPRGVRAHGKCNGWSDALSRSPLQDQDTPPQSVARRVGPWWLPSPSLHGLPGGSPSPKTRSRVLTISSQDNFEGPPSSRALRGFG